MVNFEHTYYVYILTNRKHGCLYVGMTNNLPRRMYEHKNKLVNGFCSRADKIELMVRSVSSNTGLSPVRIAPFSQIKCRFE